MDAEQSFEIECRPEYVRLAISPRLNAFNWPDVEQSAGRILSELEGARARMLIVDLSTLDYLGSSQVALLLRVWKSIKSREGRMVIQVTAPVVSEVLKTAGLQSLWEFTETREGALNVLGLSATGRRPLWPRVAALIPSLLGLVALGGAVGVVCIRARKIMTLEPRMALILVLSCSGVGLIFGLWSALRARGPRRGVGAFLIVGAAALATYGIVTHPREKKPVGRSKARPGAAHVRNADRSKTVP